MIIKLNKEHLNDLKNIEDNCFSHPLSESNLLNSLENGRYCFLGFKIDAKIVGYISVFITEDEAYINNIAVLDEFRKQKIASNLLDQMIQYVKSVKCSFITLEVRESNLPAISLYKKFGFENVAIRKNYYDKPIENAIIMTKYLEKSE